MSRDSSGVSIGTSIWTAVIMIGMILVVTAILLTLYYFGFLKVIFAWLILAVVLLLSMYIILAFGAIPELENIPVDYVTLGIFLGNICIVGVLSIFWRAPKCFTQFFLILISILTSLVFRYLPDWTIWILLLLLVVYDCCVVLCPGGLLNLLIKKSQERGDAIPALIYSTAAYNWYEDDTSGSDAGPGDASDGGGETEQENNFIEEEERVEAHQEPHLGDINDQLIDDQEEEEEAAEGEGERHHHHGKRKKKVSSRENDGIKLGLGDFVFYGILITRAARIGWDITILCIFAVILGLSLTLVILAIYERPLPALPISLLLGILFFIIGTMTFRQFNELLRERLCAF